VAYPLDFVIALGASKTGLAASLKATLLDTAGAAVAGQTDIATGFVEIGPAGTYQWHYAAFPDGHRGAVAFHTGAYAGTPTKLAASSVNPQEAEFSDAKTSGRAAAGDAMTLTAGERNSIADAILKRDWTAVTGEASRSVLNALRWLRNKWTISSGTLTVTKEDDATEAWSGPVTTSASANPVTGVDPT
jgi:hypothetical protein